MRHSGWVLVTALVLTAALALPMLLMPPKSFASREPTGPVVEAQRLVNERFSSRLHRVVFIVEATGGNLLTRDALLTLKQAGRAIRDDPALTPQLASFIEPRSGRTVVGVSTIGDVVDAVVRARFGAELADATDEQLQGALSLLFARASPSDLGLAMAERDSAGPWVAKAVMVRVFGDKDALAATAGAAADLERQQEQFARQVLERLRGEQSVVRAWGIAIDPTLTSAEQGRAAGPYIGLTIMAVLVLVGLAYRSYWAVALCGLALGGLMVWLKGLSNLVGLAGDQILDTLVPIAMISFGIDFAFHAIGRYREEVSRGLAPRRALVAAFAGVLGALLLAATSDATAFLSNATAPIEAMRQLGIAAAFALFSALFILGIVVPVALMRIEQLVPAQPRTRVGWIVTMSAASMAALGAMGAVVVLVFVSEPLGLALSAAYGVLFLAVPLLVLGRRRSAAKQAAEPSLSSGASWAFVGRLVTWFARHRRIVLPTAAALTIACATMAIRVQPRFDVKDFFAPDSDFVVGLDKFDEHVGARSGELVTVYVEAALTEPHALQALSSAVDRLRGLESPRLARTEEGAVNVQAPLLDLVGAALASARVDEALRQGGGAGLQDADSDGLPDQASALAALYEHALQHGLPTVGEGRAYPPEVAAGALWQSADGTRQATRLELRLPGSRIQENIVRAQADLAPVLDQLRAELERADPSARVVLTGTPMTRQASLDGILQAYRRALPVALLLCFLVAAAFMRSWRFAAVSIVPIVLVVAWLYAYMHLAGYGINVVTATIGAVSVGIGIDFAVHFTMRYREELRRLGDRQLALDQAGRGTGSALLVSAASSVAGFAILALAPMPMFADYGLLTAIMIAMAAAATLLVLPPLLTLGD